LLVPASSCPLRAPARAGVANQSEGTVNMRFTPDETTPPFHSFVVNASTIAASCDGMSHNARLLQGGASACSVGVTFRCVAWPVAIAARCCGLSQITSNALFRRSVNRLRHVHIAPLRGPHCRSWEGALATACPSSVVASSDCTLFLSVDVPPASEFSAAVALDPVAILASPAPTVSVTPFASVTATVTATGERKPILEAYRITQAACINRFVVLLVVSTLQAQRARP